MARFFETWNGYVNLDHVANVSEVWEERGFEKMVYRNASDDVLGVSHNKINLEEVTAPVVAAAPGATAIIIWACGEWVNGSYEARPTETHVSTAPIVAWRVMSNYAAPVFVEPVLSSKRCFIVMPDGKLCEPENQTFDDLDAAKAAVLKYAQWAWDRELKHELAASEPIAT